ncbi:L,D-transpeptidase [Acidomonas methanolica]|uniref:YkuD domain-containing protein n=2 Tax=Acidomonas methanolica TaxID=437 RepID=A0A023D8Z6_ACIMT|nr:L,D-transpeptidase [Acidomonas methanolica]MBU2655695.1 L,D-transpeptidase [Acidomonas methanolica]TCS20455.1 hypothetical protein EDC31_1452 [Acidomonas methanolica]GAJ30604.1 hypothetical protein Amme_203_009 [Acidomonas methanolica NBRC 104435]GEL00624.1 hypothetical protein AME01nite_31220 [Acidomonas methanolica NBRC 104435]
MRGTGRGLSLSCAMLVMLVLPAAGRAQNSAATQGAAQSAGPGAAPGAGPGSVAAAVSPTPEAEEPPPVIIPPLPAATIPEAHAEAARLTREMTRKVSRFSTYSPAIRTRFVTLARQAIAASRTVIDRPQLLMVVDRNPAVQRMCFVLAFPGDTPWEALGGTPVSTGQAGRKYYYITPIGVFPNTADRLGYRAEGTKNENGIRGIGAKGMRVWDLGWHNAVKGWRKDGETGDIRLEIHATDPEFLERRLGRPASEGCVRIPATMNVFMDRNGLLDVLYEQAASYDVRFRALLPKDRTPSPIAGDKLVVVDSALPATPEALSAGPKFTG